MSQKDDVKLVTKLQMDRVDFLIKQVKDVLPALKELGEISQDARQDVENQIAEFALSIKVTRLDKEQLEPFFKKPYLLLPVTGKPGSWHLIMPRFVDVQIGWLERQTPSFNVFVINRYLDWLGDVPDEIKRELDWKPPPELTLEGEDLVGPPEALAYARQKYGGLVSSRDGKLKVNKDRAFDLVAAMIKDGVLPFGVKPIDPADLVERRCDYVIRDYQRAAWDTLLKYSAIGVYYPPGTGKTVVALWAATHLKGPILIVVPTTLLVEQWVERIQTHTDLVLGKDVAVMTYQSAIKKAGATEWGLVVFDEQHHQPANTFVKISFIKRKYTLGLSATPFREDGREEYVFALSGKPVGLNWDYFKKAGLIRAPTCHVWIVKNFEAKLRKVDELLQTKQKTIIFSDSIEIGKAVAGRFKLPFAYGETKNNLATIMQNEVSVVSRVGDEGVSVPEIRRVIEVSWLGGSRRQELQRTTRLLHSQEEAQQEMHILMTLEEYAQDKKRLFSIYDKGFKLVLHQEGVDERAVERAERTPAFPVKRLVREKAISEAPNVSTVPTPQVPAALVARLPGIPGRLAKMPATQRLIASTILANPDKRYSTQDLGLATNLSYSTINHKAHFGDLIRQGFIKQVDGKWQSAL